MFLITNCRGCSIFNVVFLGCAPFGIKFREYSRLATRAGVKSFDDSISKKGSKKKFLMGDESIPDDVIPPRPKAPWFIPLTQLHVGDAISNISIFKDGTDPCLQPDESYPSWIWNSLVQPRAKQYLEDWEITTRKQLRTMNHFRIQMSNSKKMKSGAKGSNIFK